MGEANWERDAEFIEYRIESVEPNEGYGWTLSLEDGGGIGCPDSECKQAPVPGETARLYGKGFGYQVRGIVINARVYRYLTEEQEAARHAQWCRDEEAKRQAKLDTELADRDARRAKLPAPFRERIEGFIAARPDWRRDHEGYELFVCEEAAELAQHLQTPEAMRAFAAASYDEQKRQAPQLKYSEHSGNTFGAMGALARRALESPELVPKMHGALCPLVGCKEYGCFAARIPPLPSPPPAREEPET